jgi:CRP-like cAMP-binding protein
MKPQPGGHRLLSSLAAGGQALVVSHLRVVEHRRGALLVETGQPIKTVHFVADGLITILGRASDGATAEAGLVGPGGLVGFLAPFGSPTAHVDALALTNARTLALDAPLLERAVSASPALRRDLMEYAAERLAETAQLCVCAALHSVEQRLARWLLAAMRLRGDKPIELTHQQLADLFGVRRASVTAGLHLLEGEMAVRCRRGRIEIRDAAKLEARSCGCQISARERACKVRG